MSIKTPSPNPLEPTEYADDDLTQLISGDLVQKIVRSRNDQDEQIVGLFRCEFEPNQLRHTLNIPIHPPLKQIPEIETVVVDGEARIRVTNKEKFGVRMEVIVNQASSTISNVCIEVVLSSCS